MRGHNCCRARGDRRSKRNQLDSIQPLGSPLKYRQILVRINIRISVARKMFCASEKSRFRQPFQKRCAHAPNQSWIQAKTTHLSHRTRRINVQVQHRREIQIAADRGKFASDSASHVAHRVCIAKRAKLCGRRPLCEWRRQRKARAAFLIHSNQHWTDLPPREFLRSAAPVLRMFVKFRAYTATPASPCASNSRIAGGSVVPSNPAMNRRATGYFARPSICSSRGHQSPATSYALFTRECDAYTCAAFAE